LLDRRTAPISTAIMCQEVDMSKATVSGQQTTNTFAYMFVGAKAMLEQAERDPNGQLYNLVSCLIYCAFTVEASMPFP
jgi:hypothetical protein